LTPERERELRSYIGACYIYKKKKETALKEALDAIRDQRKELELLRKLENAVRALDHLGHRDGCNSYMGWGDNNQCDCPAKDVSDALAALGHSSPEAPRPKRPVDCIWCEGNDTWGHAHHCPRSTD
jgi:hypothetical protein